VKIPKRFGYLAALCVVLLPALVSCKQLVVKTPAGFAALQSADQYAAMSPEGMIYRVRVMHNSPKQSLSFWTEALTNHLQQEGYVPVSTDNEFQAGTLRGTFSEWSVPYADDTYKYLTGILVGDETIAVVEATSSHDVYDRHRAAVLESLESVDFQGVEAKGFAPETLRLHLQSGGEVRTGPCRGMFRRWYACAHRGRADPDRSRVAGNAAGRLRSADR
jgi:hypothetical protein